MVQLLFHIQYRFFEFLFFPCFVFLFSRFIRGHNGLLLIILSTFPMLKVPIALLNILEICLVYTTTPCILYSYMYVVCILIDDG